MIDDRPTVAIQCATYNHEPYIRDCLEGFVMQKTNFPFVAIIHDDASTDGTAEIVKEYAEKYPDIIKPIYETENQYSKPNKPLQKILNNAIAKTGAKYIALCEGDDYWIDPLKLQKQVDFMEANPDYTMCFHNIKVRYLNNYSKHSNRYKKTKDAPIKDVIQRGGDFIPTLSILMRAKTYFDAPSIVWSQYVGDYPLQIYLAIAGKIRYLNDVMGVYRANQTSATTTLLNAREKLESNIAKELKIYSDLNAYTNNKYTKYFENRKNFYLANQMYKLDRYSEARKYWWKSRLCYSWNNRMMILYIHGLTSILRLRRKIINLVK